MIVVTGGQGFIGRAVCATLMHHGYEVIAVDTHSAFACAPICPYITVACDIRHCEEVDRLFQHYPVTMLIHLASLLNTASRHHPFDATHVNILGSLHLFEAARQHHVTKVLYGSSISVYGSQETSGLDDRDLLSHPPAPENLYGTAKRHVEMLGMTYQQQFGGQFVALRIAAVVGVGSRSATSRWRSEIFEQLAPGHPHAVEIHIPYPGDAQLPLVFVDDVARMFVSLVKVQNLPRSLYNTPAEMWTMQALGAYTESIAPHIHVSFGQAVTGNPTTITGQTFIEEVGYKPARSLRERLREMCISYDSEYGRGK